MRWLALVTFVSSFVYASGSQLEGEQCLQFVLKLGAEVPEKMVEPFKEGEEPKRGDILAWKSEGAYKVVRVAVEEPNLFGNYHVQYNYDEKTCLPLGLLYKLIKLQARL